MFFLSSAQGAKNRLVRCGVQVFVAAFLAVTSWHGLSAEAIASPRATAPLEVISDLAQIWQIPDGLKDVPHPLRFEGRVSVYDPLWGNSWFEQNGLSTYLALSATPPALHAGQRVLIEGSLVPSKGLEAALVTVKVLQDFEPISPLDTKGRLNEFGRFGERMVSIEGYVDVQQSVDVDHVRLLMAVEGRPVVIWFKPDKSGPVPDWQGRFVRLTGLYSARFDPTGTESTIELWVGRQSDVAVIGSLADYPGFNLAVTPIAGIFEIPAGTEVHIRGWIHGTGEGSSIVVRDPTGQVLVRSAQRRKVLEGEAVDVVGQVAISEARWILRSALYRRMSAEVFDRSPPGSSGVLEGIEQICRLTSAEAAQGRKANVSGTVAWIDPKAKVFSLQDVTSGVLVRYSHVQMETPRLLQHLAVEGVTYDSGSAPAVDLIRFRNLGSMSIPVARPVTFDQAITGKENGQWIEMRGFLERTESHGDERRIYVATASGEFVGALNSPKDFVATPGSLVSICGVCGTIADSDQKITGVMLRVPFLHNITVDEDAPVDFFDLPLRPLKSLGELSLMGDLMRVRVSGVVLHSVPGRFFFLQDDQAGVLVLSSTTGPLSVGDSIEAVGILGRDGVRPVLREAVCHKLSSGAAPSPITVSDPSHIDSTLDGRLVRLRGTLIDVLRQPQHTRLTIQNGGTLFEAALDHPAGARGPASLAVGAVLDAAGIYRADFDATRQLRRFQLQLRSWGDVAVIQGPRLWTVQRALMVAAVLALAVLLGVMWVLALRRQVSQQTEQIREQMERQARLEADVQRAERLESLGVLAGGIAHDFNNLLTVVIGNLSLAMFDTKVAESAGGLLREIERAAYRARDLTQQLLTFAKGGSPIRATVALPEIVRQAAGAMLHGSSVRCEYEVAENLWNADVDKDQISQTIQNLTINAVEAMPDGGVIRISMANEEVIQGTYLSLKPGRYVRIAMADSGKGIKPEILSRIFDPYFSTKEVGGGLGLATVYSIVKRHGGWIDVESAPMHGAIFTLWLPASDAANQTMVRPVAETAPAVMSLRTARVLLMDDEDAVRRLCEILLMRIGLEPVTVSDGAAAVQEFEAARSAGRPFDLVILDLTIPGGMGGREAMEQIRAIDAQVPAIVSSGYSNDPVLAEFSRFGFQAVVPKPYEISQLLETVRRLMAQRQ